MCKPILLAATDRPDLGANANGLSSRRSSIYNQLSALGVGSKAWRVALWPRWLLRLGWSKERSMALPVGIPGALPGRTIYLADRLIHDAFSPDEMRRIWSIYGHPLDTAGTAVLAHELEHAVEQERTGRWLWLLAYAGGPLAVVMAAVLIVAGLAIGGLIGGAAMALIGCGIVLATWGDSQTFRRCAEIRGFARSLALRAVVVGVDPSAVGTGAPPLYGMRWPYLIWARGEGAAERVRMEVIDTARLMVRFQRREMGDQNGMGSSS